MSIGKEFREFAVKGNALDLAVGVIVGAAFGKIVDSIVGDLIMPIISALFGGTIDFANMFVLLGKAPDGVAMTYDALKKAGVPMFAYGNFITIMINFVLLAFAVFMIVKAVNRLKASAIEPAPAAPAEPAPPPPQEVLLGEIRDLLKARG